MATLLEWIQATLLECIATLSECIGLRVYRETHTLLELMSVECITTLLEWHLGSSLIED
jgi:hypothetical protein